MKLSIYFAMVLSGLVSTFDAQAGDIVKLRTEAMKACHLSKLGVSMGLSDPKLETKYTDEQRTGPCENTLSLITKACHDDKKFLERVEKKQFSSVECVFAAESQSIRFGQNSLLLKYSPDASQFPKKVIDYMHEYL